MHIPDNYLSPSTCAVMGAAMVPVWTTSVKKIKTVLSKEKMPLMGISAAFSFLIMMFNVPLPGGTTGHAVGGTLVAILLGPEAACIVITIALLLQALLFGDGGILAFGANSFNMAFIIPFSGYYIYTFLKRYVKTSKGDYASVFAASYIAINLAALFAAVEFGIQPILFKDASGMPLYCPYPLTVSIPAMMIPYLAAAGVLEGIVTAGVLGFIKKISPGMLYEGSRVKSRPVVVFIIALICLSPLGLIASGTAWGEWNRNEISSTVINGKALGFTPKGMEKGFNYKALLSGYSLNGIPVSIGYALSAVAGTAILVILFKLLTDTKNHQRI